MFHKLMMLFCGMGLVRLCTFNYFMNYGGPPPRKDIPVSSVPDNIISGLGLVKQSNGLYQIPGSNLYYSGENIYQPNGSGYKLGNTNYGLYEGDVKGFVKGGEDKGYSPSMAYLMAKDSNRMASNYTPVPNLNVYTPASSLLSAPNFQASYNSSAPMYGAGRFMGNGLLGSELNFNAPQTVGKSK